MTPEETLSKIFVATRNSLFRAVSRIVPPREIEDIVQETYVRVCQYEKKDAIIKPEAFLMRTARNLAIDYLKRAETRLVDSSDENPELLEFNDESDFTLQQAVSDQEFGQFCEAVRLLPVQCRKVFVLKKVYGYSQKEIAKKLGLSQSTVEKHVALGIERCNFYMMECEDAQENDSEMTNINPQGFKQRNK